ncbi:MAG: DUF4838 domain-containing protein, partial [Armatimonadetes bacterium]|nr:DUF4838 domain-containing protein [Armatimonadota bacterium]
MRVLLLAAAGILIMCRADAAKITIADDGRSDYSIVVPSKPSPTEEFAAGELSRYLERMSGAQIPIVKRSSRLPDRAVIVGAQESLPEAAMLIADNSEESDGFAIALERGHLYIVGAWDRAALNGVYEFLRLLGCRWLAPRFDHYKGTAEIVPRKPTIVYEAEEDYLREASSFPIRKLYVEEGHSHNAENLVQLIEWMPKARYNTLVVPTDYQGGGRVMWDNWREELTPELQRRGIIIEVGGHGYQNFLNAEMEGGTLFEEHPEWFGMNERGERVKSRGRVICTSNPDAVAYLTANLAKYLSERPEIRVFDFWPPDGASWCECEKCRALGEPPDRQSGLISRVKAEVAKVRPDLRLETIAYHKTIAPPESFPMD